jgi:acetylornithine deacetylase/succinyl-diaminopimelate desuccinylase-like protein
LPKAIESYTKTVRKEFERTLQEWVEIPTVSAIPDRRSDIRNGAAQAVRYLKSLGATASAVGTPGNPVVIGEFRSSRTNPTVTVYNHLDVQPADEPEWKSDPFKMQIRSGSYVGRGTTDDKGPALTALMGARYAVDNGIPINVKFIWEFEEEIGSPNFEAFVMNNLDRLATDSVVVSDTIWISRARPASPIGLRGLLSARMTLETGTNDVHSGLVGGAARNPVTELCTLIGDIYDSATGTVKTPGFYENVQPVAPEEYVDHLRSGFRTSAFQKAHGLKKLRTTDPSDLMRQIWTRPTFEVHGIVGGYQGPGVKTAIAPRAEAKVSMRLVPNQSPQRQFRLLKEYVAERNPDVVVEIDGALAPYVGPRSGAHAEAAKRAMHAAFGRTPASVREGGSIGAVVTMNDHLKVPIVFLGLSLPEHGYHAPNENFDWQQASGGISMFVHYFDSLSKLPGPAQS